MNGGPITQPYNLDGTPKVPQVEPEASYYFRCPIVRVVDAESVDRKLQDRVGSYPTDPDEVGRELDEVQAFYDARTQPIPDNRLSLFLRSPDYFRTPSPRQPIPPNGAGPPPAGAVLREAPVPVIRNGLELATLFEAETPGLWHRHVLNALLDPRITDGPGQRLSPPRQALIWAALDVAIASALLAAWRYKWLPTLGQLVYFRPRPKEIRRDLPVLYDFRVDYQGTDLVRDQLKREEGIPEFTPGTPRHPADPSGHSTYSQAASTVMACLFPDLASEWQLLANNIGEARIYGGVHYPSDHVAGQTIGRAVGELVIEQLNRSGFEPVYMGQAEAPDREDNTLQNQAIEFGRTCGQREKDFCVGVFTRTRATEQRLNFFQSE